MFTTIEQVKEAVRAGKLVWWKVKIYEVRRYVDLLGESFSVRCTVNGNCVGLCHRDGVSSDYDPSEFIVDA